MEKGININKINQICGRNLTVFQKNAICGIVKEFENTAKAELKREFENKYQDDLSAAIDHFIIAIAYTLHFNEKTKLGRKRIFDVLNDITATVNLFKTKEYSPQDYLDILKKENIKINMNLK